MSENLKELKQELARTKLAFNERISHLESRLAEAEGALDVEINEAVPTSESTEQHLLQESAQVAVHNIPQKTNLTAQKQKPSPSFISVLFSQIMTRLLTVIFEWLTPVSTIYKSYKERGMLGILILTLFGIVLTLAGFGYLMELLIDQLGIGTKALLMASSSVAVIGLGIGIKAKSKFSEFGTAIVGLGLLLAYSSVYFSGTVYGLLSTPVVLILYLIIACACHFLAVWLDTKVIAALGISGISFMPMLSHFTLDEASLSQPHFYLVSLLLISLSGLVLAYKYLGLWLVQLCFAFVVISNEWVMLELNATVSFTLASGLIDLFYILFVGFIAYCLYKPSKEIPVHFALLDPHASSEANNKERSLLILLAAATGVYAGFHLQAMAISHAALSYVFALNTLICAAIAGFYHNIRLGYRNIFISVAAIWAALFAVSALTHAYWGAAWAIEGLLLIYLSKQLAVHPKTNHYLSLLNQGQALTAIAIGYCFVALAPHFPKPALLHLDGWVLSGVILSALAIWQRLLVNITSMSGSFGLSSIKGVLQLFESIWFSVLVVSAGYLWLGLWTGALVIVLQIALVYRARQIDHMAIALFAIALITIPLATAYVGAIEVGSYRFTVQPLFGKLAIISAFVQLWWWSYCFRKYLPDGPLTKLTEAMRILFFMLIPICWVGTAFRRLDEYVLLILWLSPMLSLVIANYVKHRLLNIEFKVLILLSGSALTVASIELSFMYALLSLAGLFLVYIACYRMVNKRINIQLGRWGLKIGIFTTGFTLPIMVAKETNELLFGVLCASIYWGVMLNRVDCSAILKRNQYGIITINLLLVIASWALLNDSVWYALVPFLFISALVLTRPRPIVIPWLSGILSDNSDLFLHSIGAISYVVLLYGVDSQTYALLIAPLLAVHGALVLFIKTRRVATVKYGFSLILLGVLKLAVLDAAQAILWQKVVLFMGIGVFILFASFGYQKIVKGVQEKAVD